LKPGRRGRIRWNIKWNYFEDYLSKIESQLNISREVLLETMRIWYNGYSWDGSKRVYNPFGALNFFADCKFKNYWFATGSPNFLIEQMRKHARFDVENSIVNNTILDKYDIENIALIPLLFQTGYLTVKSMDSMTGDMVLDYPNKEVRESMYQFAIEFKFNKTAQEAIDQIEANNYAQKYQTSGKTITGIGLNFNTDTRGIDDWMEKVL
jgi:PD-(D/E)XK nuclease superfamily/Predicted AAA-ATPase